MQVRRQLRDLSQYSDIAFTSRNGIHAVMELLQGLHGSPDAALQALQTCKAQCWALGADAEALRELGVHNVQMPKEVCPPTPAFLASITVSTHQTCKLTGHRCISRTFTLV